MDVAQTRDNSEYTKDDEQRLKMELTEQCKREEAYCRQRSRIQWLNEGDRNTKFLHQMTIERRRNNKILSLQRDDDTWIES